MLKAYCDESGKHETARFIVMAGYVGTAAEWDRFGRAWKAIASKLPSGSFHASDFECGFGSYNGVFSRRQTEEIQAKLISVIRRHEVFGYYAGVSRKAYGRVEARIKGARRKYWSPYFLCFQHVMELCCRHGANPQSEEGVSFVFDRQDEFRGRASEIFDSMKGAGSTLPYKARLGTLRFSDRQDLAPLQAADFLAYESYKWLDQTRYGLSRARWQWRMLNQDGRISGYGFESRSMQKLLEAAGW